VLSACYAFLYFDYVLLHTVTLFTLKKLLHIRYNNKKGKKMSLEKEFDDKLQQLEEVFKEKISEMHKKIIDGSPVDSGGFKTSWQLLEFDPKKLSYHLHNPKKYGMKLWRFHHSKQGWSPTGGDIIIEEFKKEMNEAVRRI